MQCFPFPEPNQLSILSSCLIRILNCRDAVWSSWPHHLEWPTPIARAWSACEDARFHHPLESLRKAGQRGDIGLVWHWGDISLFQYRNMQNKKNHSNGPGWLRFCPIITVGVVLGIVVFNQRLSIIFQIFTFQKLGSKRWQNQEPVMTLHTHLVRHLALFCLNVLKGWHQVWVLWKPTNFHMPRPARLI